MNIATRTASIHVHVHSAICLPSSLCVLSLPFSHSPIYCVDLAQHIHRWHISALNLLFTPSLHDSSIGEFEKIQSIMQLHLFRPLRESPDMIDSVEWLLHFQHILYYRSTIIIRGHAVHFWFSDLEMNCFFQEGRSRISDISFEFLLFYWFWIIYILTQHNLFIIIMHFNILL